MHLQEESMPRRQLAVRRVFVLVSEDSWQSGLCSAQKGKESGSEREKKKMCVCARLCFRQSTQVSEWCMLVCAENIFKHFITRAAGKPFGKQERAVNKIKISLHPTSRKNPLRHTVTVFFLFARFATINFFCHKRSLILYALVLWVFDALSLSLCTPSSEHTNTQ